MRLSRLTIPALAAVMSLTLCSVPAFAQKKAEKLQKIGCVDVREIFDAMPQSAAVQRELEKKQQEFQQKKSDMERALDLLVAQVSEDRNRRPQEVLDLNAQISSKRRELNDFIEKSNQELADAEQKLLQPVLARLQGVIKDVAQKNGLSMVIDRSTYVLYVDKEYDITQAVIEAMKKEQQAEALEQTHD
jgi:outer membrane protein